MESRQSCTLSLIKSDGEGWIFVVKLLRACGGCLGIRRQGVEVCEKLGVADKRALIPRYPLLTRRTETSKYPEEKKEKSIPSVAASEIGIAQTLGVSPEGL